MRDRGSFEVTVYRIAESAKGAIRYFRCSDVDGLPGREPELNGWGKLRLYCPCLRSLELKRVVPARAK